LTIKNLLAMRKKKAKAAAFKKTAKTVAIGAAAGAAAGMAAGMLLAPAPGSETRARIKQGAKKAAAAVRQTVRRKAADAPEA
jgi:gas vesicle protein